MHGISALVLKRDAWKTWISVFWLIKEDKRNILTERFVGLVPGNSEIQKFRQYLLYNTNLNQWEYQNNASGTIPDF
ncbi:hypothetical protein RhiirA4_464413 [Rhizophagus irregularis]|uniref:Uncharacterized protein n=1 Tax=Rhizophagus irregularis TaxID=588596 RepID=A0A2I1GQ22_9GLOM|nr:hypothetical protein RhiirA4_464413 [Rhizophagus irregularis]